jgi:hypothetical protein
MFLPLLAVSPAVLLVLAAADAGRRYFVEDI